MVSPIKTVTAAAAPAPAPIERPQAKPAKPANEVKEVVVQASKPRVSAAPAESNAVRVSLSPAASRPAQSAPKQAVSDAAAPPADAPVQANATANLPAAITAKPTTKPEVPTGPPAPRIYEPADADKDGRISVKEQQDFETLLAARKAELASATGNTSAAGQAVKAYQTIDQLGAAATRA